MHFSIDRTVHTTAFDKPVVDHWLERKIAQTAAGSTEKDRSDDRPLQRRARYRLSYIPFPFFLRFLFCILGEFCFVYRFGVFFVDFCFVFCCFLFLLFAYFLHSSSIFQHR